MAHAHGTDRRLTFGLGLAICALLAGAACQRETAPSPTERVSSPASVPTDFVDEQFISGLAGPTAMAFTPDGRLLVAELTGKVRVIKNGALLPTPFTTITVNTMSGPGERGLMGIAVDPNFATNHFVYVYYTASTPAIHSRVARYQANGDVAVTSPGPLTLMDLENAPAEKHNGGGLQFGNDGKLYVGVGENTVTANSQNLNTRLGKLLRVNSDGTIPTDNPFYNVLTGTNRSIWAWGLRNPYTFAFRRTTGTLYINDVGNNQFEEIDLGVAGANYGWPETEGPTTNPAHVNPIYHYVNERPMMGPTCAIVGGTFYDPTVQQFPASYVGQYFFADFCGNFIKVFDPATRTASPFAAGISAPVDLDVGPIDGSLYYLARGTGTVGRIRFAQNQPPGISAQPASVTRGVGQTATFTVAATGSQPLNYQWKRDNVDIPGATSSSYTTGPLEVTDNGAQFKVVVSNAVLPGGVTSNSATLTVINDQPPVPTINLPAAGSQYSAGQTISYSGVASDPETGALPASAFSWRVDFHHANHVHPFLSDTPGVTGGSFGVTANDETDTNVFYRIYLTVTDPAGLVTRISRDITPRVASITLLTNPPGLHVTVDGQPKPTPYSVDTVVGQSRAIGVVSPQSAGGTFYTFTSWSDGGASAHNITVPAAGATYTASYSGVTPFLESGGQVVMEAENFTGTAAGTGTASGTGWTVGTLSGASGSIITATPNSGVNTADNLIGARRDYAVRFVTTGTYQVWVRLRGPSGGDDSIHVGLNGAAATLGAQGLSNGTTLGWKNVKGTSTRVTVNVATAGVATINLWLREDGVQVDKLLFTKTSTFTPTGTGPAESPHDAPATPPSAPSNFAAGDGVGQSVLTWTDTSNNETGFKIERKPQGTPDSSYAQVGTVGVNVATFTNTSVPAGTYTYRVKSTNAAGDTASMPDDAVISNPPPPSAPSGLVANDGVGQATLNWNDNSGNETGFRIERKTAGAPDSSYAQVGTVGANVINFTNSPVAAGSYTYRVFATNANGDSLPSNADDATVTAPMVPSAPTGLVANDGVNQSSLTWMDTANNETGFKVERKVQGAADSTYTQVGTPAANAQSFTDTSVPAGLYTYRVKATNAVGDSTPSNSDDATVTGPPPPSAPTNLVANDGVGQSVLTWTDASSNETGFKIERKPQGSPDTSYAQVGTVGANVQTFTNTSVPAGTYTYRVKATNANGDSLPSNSDDATVTAAPAVSITNLVVNDTSTANPPAGSDGIANSTQWSVQANFQAGVVAFGDRTYTVDSVGGSEILAGPWIRTAADSKNYTGTPLATFTANGSFVYLIIDDRYNGTGGRPAFLTDAAFVDTGFNVVVRQSSTSTFPYSVWKKPITSGSTVQLPKIGLTTAPCYFVVVK